MLDLIRTGNKIFSHLNMNALKSVLVAAGIIAVFHITYMYNFVFFHSIVEVIGIIIYFSVALIVYNTYHLSQKIILTFYGISYCFVAVFSLLHFLTFKQGAMLESGAAGLSIYFNIVSKYMESLSLLLLPFLTQSKKLKSVKPGTMLSLYGLLSIILFAAIFPMNAAGLKLVNHMRPTYPARIHEFIIACIFISTLIFSITRKKIRSHYFSRYLFAFLTAKILSQFLSAFYYDLSGACNEIHHILKLICFYCIYKMLVEATLRKPLELLFENMNNTSTELEKMTLQLKQTSRKLTQENIGRKKTETRLLQSKKRYNQLIELFPEGILMHHDGIITSANASALRLIGAKSSGEVIGKSTFDFLYYDHDNPAKNCTEQINGPEFSTCQFEEKLVQLNGTIIDVEILSTPVEDSSMKMIMSIVRDITGRKKAEELKRSIYERNLLLNKTMEVDKLKSEFFSNISHELRTPLTVILSTIQLSAKYLDTGVFIDKGNKMPGYFSIMSQNCLRLLKLVNNLIDVTKIDSGYFYPSMRNCNIISIIEEITLSVSRYIEARDISLTFDTDTEEKIISCDPEKIERIILNILSNAAKFTKSGGSIFVNIYDRGTSIIVSIRDTGIGIPKNRQAEIFERFKQIDQSLTRNYEGGGIGLSLAKSFIEMHNGTIKIESEPGKGSNFIIELPAKAVEAVPEESVKADGASVNSRIERIKIEFSDI